MGLFSRDELIITGIKAPEIIKEDVKKPKKKPIWVKQRILSWREVRNKIEPKLVNQQQKLVDDLIQEKLEMSNENTI